MKNQVLVKPFSNARWEAKAKVGKLPSKRWGHSAIVYNKKLVIYGGKTGKARKKQPLYIIDCQTGESDIIEGVNSPLTRESHSCHIVKDKLRIWGGCHEEQVLSDCLQFTFNQTGGYWTSVAQFPQIKPRQSHASTTINDKYLMIYGGCTENDEILDQIQVFNFETSIWYKQTKIIGEIQKKVGAVMQMINGNIYVYGGQKSTENEYCGQVQRFTFDHLHFQDRQSPPTITIQTIKVQGQKPSPRGSHASVVYKNRYFIVIGGQGKEEKSSNQTNHTFYNDIWSFDVVQQKWLKILVQNQSLFKPRSFFTANLYKNRIFIFGGLTCVDPLKFCDELMVLWLDEDKQSATQICSICKFNFRPQGKQLEYKYFAEKSQHTLDLGVQLFFKIAKTISTPYEAIGLMVFAFKTINTESLGLKMLNSKYFIIKGSVVNLTDSELQKIFYNFSESKIQQMLDQRLKYALSQQITKRKINNFGYYIKLAAGKLSTSFYLIYHFGTKFKILRIHQKGIFQMTYRAHQPIDQLPIYQRETINALKQYLILDITSQNEDSFKIHQSSITIVITDTLALQQIIHEFPHINKLKTSNVAYTNGQLLNNSQNHHQSKHQNCSNSGRQICYKNKLFKYLEHLFPEKCIMTLKINEVPICFKSLKNQLKNLQSLQIQKSQSIIQEIKICSNDELFGGIFYYHNEKLVGKSKDQSVKGYAILNSNLPLSISQMRLESYTEIQLAINQIVEHFKINQKKRKASINIVNLQNQDQANIK